jgi:hypothetical protein
MINNKKEKKRFKDRKPSFKLVIRFLVIWGFIVLTNVFLFKRDFVNSALFATSFTIPFALITYLGDRYS